MPAAAVFQTLYKQQQHQLTYVHWWSQVTLRVDMRVTGSLLGTVIKYIALAMLIPLSVAIVYQEDIWVFALSIGLTISMGLLLEQLDDEREIGAPEALLLVTTSWVAVSLIGAIPYLLAGYETTSTLAQPVNALFESTSGFTTTGATVMGSISVDQHSHALLMWRQLTQWLGGMGIIVLMIAILPELGVNGAQLLQTEAPGPDLQKLTPRIAKTARVLWLVYFGFTVLLVIALTVLHQLGMAPNMTFYNALAHAFTTLPTGGFSPEANSIAAFSPLAHWTIFPFMIVAGTNFALFWYLLSGDIRSVVEDPEFRAYLGVVSLLIVTLAVVLYRGAADSADVTIGQVSEGAAGDAIREAAFQIGSLLNSTGYATSDFAGWDPHAQAIILFAMFIGGSAGSTGGGIKIIRWLVIFKAVRRELATTARPGIVKTIRLGDTVIDEEIVRAVTVFTALYLVLYGVATVFFILDGIRVGYELTMLEAMSASIATLGNIGPGFGSLGPFGSYLALPAETKIVMVFLMWIGRLEIVPVLAIFTGLYWRST